ncbi:PREDICTED: uncharacterized protein LOC108555960 [Eufriesea mexicana]|uniref:uncharacterized protein LOC108555960 n=1 Tax=Eufriesea mexicana TaxID=516756 RepID=UPI00083C059B|nr:PREDICTED: uncharacterized protein LOC108555960 [Eufriesea mexicana]
MLRILCRLTYVHNIKNDLWIQSLQKCSTLIENNVEKNIENYLIYEPSILYIINKSKLSVLKKYIEVKCADAIILTRIKDGYYTSLKDLLLRTQINLDTFNQLCNSIIDSGIKYKMKVTPNIEGKIKPNTILGIHIGQTILSWSLLSYDFKVLDWDCITWQNNSLDRTNVYDIISVASTFVNQLPPSDTYVMQDFNKATKQVYNLYNVHIGIASCLKFMIRQRQNNSITSENDVYILSPLMAAYCFRLILGNEVLATKYIMNVILNDVKLNNEKLPQIHIDNTLKSKYIKLNNMQKEELNWSLLKALTFGYFIKSSRSTN